MSEDGVNKPVIQVLSFGFKSGNAPAANALFDVRFLKNPFWVEELRPLSGRDKPVRDYVLDQEEAQQLLGNIIRLIEPVIPAMFAAKTDTFVVAFGCTGGQHRSVAMAEALAERLQEKFPQYETQLCHRELERAHVAGAKE